MGEPWDSEHNRTLIAKMPKVFYCPASKHKQTDGLATYVFATGQAAIPAIFSGGKIPPDAAGPAIVLSSAGGENAGTRQAKGARVRCKATVFGAREFAGDLLPIARAAFLALDRAVLLLSGWTIMAVTVEPPRAVKDGDGFPGLEIELRANVLKT